MGNDIRASVQKYLDEGLTVLPVRAGEKATRFKRWSEPGIRAKVEDFEETDNAAERLDGQKVDIDCDCPETRRIARSMLLPTERIHARPSLVDEGPTHYWYEVVDGVPKNEQFKDVDGSVLIEIRNGVGQYTLVPPSIVLTKSEPHLPEVLIWEIEGTAGRVPFDGLRRAVVMVATAALLGRHWPSGSRHVAARDASGFLAARGFSEEEVVDVIKSAAMLAGDSELEDRVRAARDSVRNFTAGKATTGLPTLEASIGKEIVAVLKRWHGGSNGAVEEVVEEMNARHFYATVGKDTVVCTPQEKKPLLMQQERALFSWYANAKVVLGEREITKGQKKGQTEQEKRSKFEVWREHPKRRQYRTVVFAPPPLVADPRDFNIWTGFDVAPDADPHPETRCSRYLALVRDVICGGEPERRDEFFEYLLDLLALTVQRPGEPSGVAVVVKGEKGTGKGTFVRHFGSLFGPHFVHVAKAEHVTGKFNVSLSGSVVVFADEAFWAGDKQGEAALKVLITEPTLRIERKGIDPVTEPNVVHLFMAANEEWAIPARFNERRFFVLKVSNAFMQDPNYFDAISEEMKNGGREALLAFLLARTITAERRKSLRSAPKTEELAKQVGFTMENEIKWWKEKLEDGVLNAVDGWPDDVDVKALHDDYLGWCDKMKINRRVLSNTLVRDTLAPYLGKTRRPRTEDGPRPTLRALKSLAESRAIFDKVSGIAHTWDEGLEDAPRPPDLPF
jgi:hypothetical protein